MSDILTVGNHPDVSRAYGAREMAEIELLEAHKQPEIAIVIPVYKHSVLVTEAIGDALREARLSRGVIILVNDGCPYPETHEVCTVFADAFPQMIDYIKTPNGGLSAARNRGIRYAFARYPTAQYVYLLDADNRLSKGAMGRALRAMSESGADWVYPNIDKFGIEWSGDFSAPYSVLRHLFQNICEAGSFIHRRVFDAGIFFDESMRFGYEDWEFWLQCCEAGFRGAPCADFGFRYRARRESMVRNSDRESASIIAYMQRKHHKLYSWKNVLLLEHLEAPRFCIIDGVYQRYVNTSIPAEASAAGHIIDLDRVFWLNDLYPTHVHFPNFIVVVDHRVMEELRRLKMEDTVFWAIEDALESHSFVYVTLDTVDDKFSLEVCGQENYGQSLEAGLHIVAVQRRLMKECVLDRNTAWIDSIRTPSPSPSISRISISGPFAQSVLRNYGVRQPLATLFYFFNLLRESLHRPDEEASWEWREASAAIPSAELFRNVRAHMHAMGPLARCSNSGEHEIAFLVPIASFGGVEQVAIQVARQFRSAGWKTRLVVTERNIIAAPMRFVEAFDAICFLNDSSFSTWQPSGMKYFGHDLQKWPTEGRHDRLHGLLAGCGAAMVLQATHGYEAMGWLRRQGMMTISSLHLLDRDVLGAPVGHPYLMLGYEHAFDIVTACSRNLLAFCSGAGVPREKLLYLGNAPTFVVTDRMRRRREIELAGVEASDAQGAHRPLRLLSLGRLDRQKGVERLSGLIQSARAAEMPVEWRLVGGRTVELSQPTSAKENTDLRIEPPVYERSQVVELLMWADVVVMLSHWEGAPLLILEAQSVGAIPLVTNVGGISEMIQDGEDGILIENGPVSSVVRQALHHIEALSRDVATRTRLAHSAMDRMRKITWEVNCAGLVARVVNKFQEH